MSGWEILLLGKAIIWFAVPLAFAGWQVWRLSRDEH
jgi:hypothetical protein